MSSSIHQSSADAIIANLTHEFLVDAADRLGELGILVSKAIAGELDMPSVLADIRREVHTLKGTGSTFGFPSVTVIAHHLENYLADLETLDIRLLDDVLRFFDRMQDITDSGENPDDEALAGIVRALPAKGAAGDAGSS